MQCPFIHFAPPQQFVEHIILNILLIVNTFLKIFLQFV
nr:MAG TPA: hypothetical protein [Caudoviricetes sp.]